MKAELKDLQNLLSKAKDEKSGGTFPRRNNRPYFDPNKRYPTSPRDITTVTCFKCSATGHYANKCPTIKNKSTENSKTTGVASASSDKEPEKDTKQVFQ